jgi:hypothetical protein
MGSQSLLRHDIFIGKIIYAACDYCANDLILEGTRCRWRDYWHDIPVSAELRCAAPRPSFVLASRVTRSASQLLTQCRFAYWVRATNT